MDLNQGFKSQVSALYSHQNSQDLISKPGSLNGSVVRVEHLTDCEVWLLDHTSGVVVDTCRHCRIRIGPVSGSCHLRNCESCTISVASRDLTINNSKDMILYLYSTNNPHVEHSSQLTIAPYNFAYPMQNAHFKKAGLNAKVNCWERIEDHTPAVTGKNWSYLPVSERQDCSYEITPLGPPENPLLSFIPKGQLNHGSDLFHPQSPKALSEDLVPESEVPPINPFHSIIQKDVSYVTEHTQIALTEPEKTEVIRVFYTREEEFMHEIALPPVGIGMPQVLATLQKASNAAAPFHNGIDMLEIGQFTVLLVGLLLALVVVLLDLFVQQHDAGTAIELFLIVLCLVVIEVVLAVRLRAVLSQGNIEIRHLLEQETNALYKASGVEVRGDLSVLEVVTSSSQ